MVSKNALIRQKFNFDKFTQGAIVELSGWAGKRANAMYFVSTEISEWYINKVTRSPWTTHTLR